MNRFQTRENEVIECRFCTYIQHSKGRDPIDTPWMSSSKYSAFVSIGALVPGWSLVLPNEHKTSLSTEYKSKDFWDFTSEAVSTVQEVYGSVSVFEHGASKSDSKTSCGTGHAHLHIAPLEFSLFDAAKEYQPNRNWEKCRADEIAEKSKEQEYLYVSDRFLGADTDGYICILTEETSQFFRKVIAKKIGNPKEFDYKIFKNIETTKLSAKTLSDHIWSKCKNSRRA